MPYKHWAPSGARSFLFPRLTDPVHAALVCHCIFNQKMVVFTAYFQSKGSQGESIQRRTGEYLQFSLSGAFLYD